ncbi:MAG: M23 family metallopeptidase [Acidobacteriota bacterium]
MPILELSQSSADPRSGRSCRRSVLVIQRALAVCVLLFAGLAAPAPLQVQSQAQDRPTVNVDPGGIARWAAGDSVSCAMNGRSWAALEGVCYYPVDVQQSPDVLEIARWLDSSPIDLGWLVVNEKEFELQSIEFPDDDFVHLSPENLARLYEEQALIKPIFRRRGGPARFTLPLGQPLESPPEARYFGVRREFNGEPKNPHTGIDYAIGVDNPVLAVADGTVVLTGEHFFAGTSVYLHHGDGLVSMYFHLNSIEVEEGAEVKRGDTIAKVGSTGRSTGPHLHLGIRWRGARVDPSLLLADPSALPTVAAAEGSGAE